MGICINHVYTRIDRMRLYSIYYLGRLYYKYTSY